MQDTLTTLQGMIWPEPGLCTERDLYVRPDARAAFSQAAREIHVRQGGLVQFDTYYNLFNIGKWVKHCALETLWLTLDGEGEFELVVFLVQPDRSWERLVNEVIRLDPDAPTRVRLDGAQTFGDRGVLFFEMRALGEDGGVMRDAQWQTADAPRRQPDLMLSVTTFRREAAVARTAERFERFIDKSPLKGRIRMTVVDNGQSAEIPPSDHIRVVPNENLGGSGGFARGLLEARDSGATHCLFMDDDAAVHMQAFERTWMFLAYATEDKVAIAGAVSNAQHRWQLWENGALFHHICQPQHGGTDLRDIRQVLELEFDSTATRPHNFYGGWWYFAFPVAMAEHMPFPFFVRGDDVSFSLVHAFDIVTLPGVISYQDEDFSGKESPLTVYLDLRSHMAHHLSLDSMAIGRKGIMKIMLRFYFRSLLPCHYETLEAIGLALEDVQDGPAFFEANADMAARRAQIGKIFDQERWRKDDTGGRKDRVWLPSGRWLPRFLMKLTLNGHLLPGFGYIANRITLPAGVRGAIRPIWGAGEITYTSADGRKSYTVRHDKARALGVSRPIWAAMRAIWRDYDALCADWHSGYDRLTTEGYWRKRLDAPAPEAKPADAPAPAASDPAA
ncbi:glycosyltransferase [Salipiger aestuarii]|uniref:glycosyltransferase n=1 Tax=Salipiger aestuarii TaxID=568098 RepID=UPI001239BF7D|nr:glycosyltransferase [Salipiger aestuarii]KAA8610006.1 hypothetical protein AL037_14210 [Salipiger aestuarii]